MSGNNKIDTAKEAYALPDAQWVQDADGKAWCLIDTHFGFPQRMAAHKRYCTALENLVYPLHLGDFIGECEHKWGHHELGRCIRCCELITEPRPVLFGDEAMNTMRLAAEANSRNEARAQKQGGSDE